jgi:hypothetical protein
MLAEPFSKDGFAYGVRRVRGLFHPVNPALPPFSRDVAWAHRRVACFLFCDEVGYMVFRHFVHFYVQLRWEVKVFKTLESVLVAVYMRESHGDREVVRQLAYAPDEIRVFCS